jgi:hypothetical protein
MKPHIYLDVDGKWRLRFEAMPFGSAETRKRWLYAWKFCKMMNERRLLRLLNGMP